MLFDSARPLFEELGHTLLYGDAQTWFLRATGWEQLETSTPDVVLGMNLGDAMPAGDEARAFRRLQNEVQMLWFEHPVNTARAARGLAPVNAIWPWGAGGESSPSRPLAVCAAPAWMQAMADQVLDDPREIMNATGDTLLLCGALTGSGLAGEWAAWLDAMHQLESELFAPTLALLQAGKVKSVRLVLSHRTALFEATTTTLALRKFWRRITLDHLL